MPFMVMLLVLADDLTGALDTGVQFARGGIPTRVYLKPVRGAVPEPGDTEVLVINANTRHCSADGARRIIRSLAYRYRHIPYLYKKTDSTLRGHIGAELEALMDGGNIRRLPFIPAYPLLGRTTWGGVQLLRGIPVDQTETAADALNPIRRSFIPAIIAEESALPVRLVPAGAAGWEEALAAGAGGADGRDILVFDCGSSGELGETAGYLRDRELLRGSAGCAGFAGALMEALPFSAPRGMGDVREGACREIDRTLPLLILSGSRHPLSVQQVKTALAGGITGLPIRGEDLLRKKWLFSAEGKALIGRAAAILREEGIALLGTAAAMGLAGGESPAGKGETHEGPARVLGALALEIRRAAGPLHWAVFGGDTLMGLTAAMKFEYIIPVGEIRPGIVFARAEGPDGGALMAAKSGAFGEPGIIGIIREFFTNASAGRLEEEYYHV
ncbi:MAG: four-carbon acid sugar kinase family protein [Treponema sp.]|jgi:uncharacterized protein YgbK (DUF1537 family)|nr:four-carbon acid sugar kinase family protein [Treponema sp.]